MKEQQNIDYSVGRFSASKKEVEQKRKEAERAGGDPEEAGRLFLEKFSKANNLLSAEATRKAIESLQKAFDKEFGSKKE